MSGARHSFHHHQHQRSIAPPKDNMFKTLSFVFNLKLKSMTSRNRKQYAAWTRQQLQDLGPTYVKLGQFISTRPDIFDEDLIAELRILQDNVPSFSYDIATEIVRAEVGHNVFQTFEERPIASASISQVHKATLVDSGETVAVKIQRPYIKEYFDNDFDTLVKIFDFAGMFNIRSINDTKMLLEQCYSYLYEELSFDNELKNATLFTKIVEKYPNVIVPRPLGRLCTSRVLTMQYIPSTKVNEVKNRDLSLELMQFFIEQVIDYGVIHADPHPGNIGITDDGKIVLYDFGQVSSLNSKIVASIKPLIFAIFDRDVKEVTSILIDSEAIILTSSTKGTRKIVEDFVNMVLMYFEKLDIKSFSLSSDMSLDPPFKINPQLILVFRSLSLLEGICKQLDPKFSYYNVVEAFIGDMFFDYEYVEHRARKDLSTFFNGVDESVEPQQTVDTQNGRLSDMEKTMKVLIGLVTTSIFIQTVDIIEMDATLNGVQMMVAAASFSFGCLASSMLGQRTTTEKDRDMQ
jgi:predicted unusual protein kinase regulating ubiquinone biosynthesis (AarF/ABC1/UbiB family)